MSGPGKWRRSLTRRRVAQLRILAVIAALVAVALAISFYIAVQQRLPLPLQHHYRVNVELATAAGVTAGVGQAVDVSGVRVGTIAGSHLAGGHAVVELEIDATKLRRVYANASAMLVPNTPIKDMLIEMYPGAPPARPLPSGGTIPIARTTPPIDLDELEAALDRDARDFFSILVAGADQGTAGRGEDFRKLATALGPTARQLRELADAVAARRRALARFVHNLALLGRATQSHDRDLSTLLVGANRTLQALSSQRVALGGAVARLPATLRTTARTLGHTAQLARELRPAAAALLPAARRLAPTLQAVRPLVDEATPILRRRVRPAVRELQPLAGDLSTSTHNLNTVTPALTGAFRVLQYVANELAYNPPGRNEGFLFWFAWFAHNIDSAFAIEDAHGAIARGFDVASCDLLASQPTAGPVVDLLKKAGAACPGGSR
jgi:phospholipid/cholesterol/gamma-HCH transport system substrate-binding protein